MVLVLYILVFLVRLKLVMNGEIKKGRIEKLDYKQTNKSTGTTSIAEWQRGCDTRQEDKESTSEEFLRLEESESHRWSEAPGTRGYLNPMEETTKART